MQHSPFRNIQFPLILATAFLDILGIGILIPIFPFLIKGFWMSAEWVGYSMAITSAGMFLGWFIFWRLSDVHWRRSMLLWTSACNILGYISLIFAPTFVFFLVGRFIAGLAWSGIGVTQAYVSDISTPATRMKKMWLIGAMFGLGFLIGPAIGWLLASVSNTAVALAGVIAATANFLLILLFLPESKKQNSKETPDVPGSLTPLMVTLFVLSFVTTVAFSPIQAISWQYYVDMFHFNAAQISHVLIVIGLTSILYQGFLIKYLRVYFKEISMMFLGILLLLVWFLFQAINTHPIALWAILPLFPLGMGALQPSINSLVAKDAWESTGKYLGMNNSYMSIGNIVGPILAGYLYGKWYTLPFIASALLLSVTLFFVYWVIYKRHAHAQ